MGVDDVCSQSSDQFSQAAVWVFLVLSARVCPQRGDDGAYLSWGRPLRFDSGSWTYAAVVLPVDCDNYSCAYPELIPFCQSFIRRVIRLVRVTLCFSGVNPSGFQTGLARPQPGQKIRHAGLAQRILRLRAWQHNRRQSYRCLKKTDPTAGLLTYGAYLCLSRGLCEDDICCALGLRDNHQPPFM